MLKLDASDLIQKINSLHLDPAEIAEAIADQAVIPEVADYPSPQHRKQPFKSDKQRRKVFAMIKEGLIPYTRTGALGATVEKAAFGQGMEVNWTMPYAEIVIGENQSSYFDYWPNVQKVAQKIEGGQAEQIAEAKVIDALNAAGLT